MITALDHIAIAVPDLEASIKRFMEDFGLEFSGTEDVEAAKTSTAFFPLPPTSIELVHPLRGQGPIAKYLEKKGGGMHHLCFRSDNIDEDIQRLKAKIFHKTLDASLKIRNSDRDMVQCSNHY